MNLFETVTMIKAINQALPAHSFLKDTFFPSSKTLMTENVLIDSKKGNRKLAPFVAPRVGGVTIDREGFATSSIMAPKIAPQRVLTMDDIETRGFGESIISTKTPEQRQYEIIANDLKEFDEMITRREEKMIRDLLFTGKIQIKGYVDTENSKTVDMEINYGEVKEFTPTVKWNATGATKPSILADLRKWRQEITKVNGVAPNIALMSSDLIDVIFEDEKVSKLFDSKNINIGKLEPKVGDAVTYIGKILSLGLEVYSYDEWFYNEETKKEGSMIPEGTILLGNKNIGEIRYGLITQVENGKFKSYAEAKVPKTWVDESNDRRMIRLSSRPVPVPHNLDAWGVAKVL